MGKKMKLPFLSNNKEEEEAPRHHPWKWALCKQPKTLSFRAGDDVFKTVNSVFFDLNTDGADTSESWFTSSSQSARSFSTQSEDREESKLGSVEDVIIRGAQSNRLFFEPGDSRSILKEQEKAAAAATSHDHHHHHHHHKVLFKESSVVLAMESEDPYEDFKRSMEEMVESYGLKDWECLEELLGWYLKVNGKKNHRFIVGAFVDLLVSMGGASSSSSSPFPSSHSSNCCDASTSFSSADTSFSSPLSPLEEEICEKTVR